MLSTEALDILEVAKQAFDKDEGPTTKVDYELDFENPRDGEILSTLRFKLGKPITQEKADQIVEEMFPLLSSTLGLEAAAQIAARLVEKQGIRSKKEKLKSTFNAEFLDTPLNNVAEERAGAARSASGRFVSQMNLKASLELLMKENMLATMTSPSAGTGPESALKYRTGRLLNSANIVSVSVPESVDGTMSIYYRYMVYPYQVFDPKNTQSPDNGLASNMRNPQKLIGDALASAARRLLSKRYKFIIRQAY